MLAKISAEVTLCNNAVELQLQMDAEEMAVVLETIVSDSARIHVSALFPARRIGWVQVRS